MTSFDLLLRRVVRHTTMLLAAVPLAACGAGAGGSDAAPSDALSADALSADASTIDVVDEALFDAPIDAPADILSVDVTPGPPFVCGRSTCRTNSEWCFLQANFGGTDSGTVPPPPNEARDYTPFCYPMPAACAASPTCACILMHRPAAVLSFGEPWGTCSIVVPGGFKILGQTAGRTTEGVSLHAAPAGPSPSETAAWLGAMASLEAEAVLAFERLGVELLAHRAPAQLVARMRRAADEERSHAALLGALARAQGVVPATPTLVIPDEPRPLLEIALENAREGLAREPFGALLARWQATHAPTPALRALFDQIATEEARHCEDSLALDAWARSLLGPAACTSLDDARRGAFTQLRAALEAQTSPTLAAAFGLPTGIVQRALFDALSETLAIAA